MYYIQVFISPAKDVYRPPGLRGLAPSVKVVRQFVLVWISLKRSPCCDYSIINPFKPRE